MDTSSYDLTIFGATGFTGAFVSIELARILHARTLSTSSPVRVALAGRSISRLTSLLDRITREVPGFDSSKFSLLCADINDPHSLDSMTLKTQGGVLINCVGPFRLYGEAVVRSCLLNSCHYVDITGEPEFMERCELKFGDEAASKGLFIVPCSAFDSIPADLGVAFAVDALASHCHATATSVASFLTLHTGPAGFGGHFATYQSAVLGYGSVKELKRTRREYVARHPHLARIPFPGPPPPKRGAFFWHSGSWCLPFMGSDASVVRRSQRAVHAQRLLAADAAATGGATQSPLPLPVHYEAYFTVSSTWNLCLTILFGGALSLLAPWAWGRRLLLAFPGLFSGGIFSHQGPSETQLAETSFSMAFFVRGFKTSRAPEGAVANSSSSISIPPADVEAKCVVKGAEPGYIATPKILLGAAFTLLEDRVRGVGRVADGKGGEGGVLTPATAFRGTGLLNRLKLLGITFEFVSSRSL